MASTPAPGGGGLPGSTVVSVFKGPTGGRLSTAATSRLTLASGMTAGYGVPPHVIGQNPRVHPGTYGGNPAWAPLRQGLLRSMPGVVAGKFKQYTLYFMFNPNQITASFMTNTSQIPATYLYYGGTANGNNGVGQNGATNGTKVTVPNVANAQTVSWSLIFDRTYDLLYGADRTAGRGVLVDVAALYSLMATFDSAGAVPLSTPCQVCFGVNAANELWGFTGFISSVNITYGIFRANMMPSRCEIDIQMTTTYIAPMAGGGYTGGLPGQKTSTRLPYVPKVKKSLPSGIGI